MDSNLKIEVSEALTDELINDIYLVSCDVFPDPKPKEKLMAELNSKFNRTIYLVYDEKKPIAFKVGFERSKRIYYSWLGGVNPKYRKQGIAKNLMEIQHKKVKQLGYKVVCTHTDNKFKPMIILNLKSGFEIRGTLQSTGDNYLTLYLEKDLTLNC